MVDLLYIFVGCPKNISFSNPFRAAVLQAMDRAHRLGQVRTVNVYRLLMRHTLEERIMSLQQFKMDVAAAVVNQDNVSLSAMDTTRLLDLFGATGGAARPSAGNGAAPQVIQIYFLTF